VTTDTNLLFLSLVLFLKDRKITMIVNIPNCNAAKDSDNPAFRKEMINNNRGFKNLDFNKASSE
jgi:hypothetical protein